MLDPRGHDIKLKSFKTSVALEFRIGLQSSRTTSQSSKSKYDRKLLELDVGTGTVRRSFTYVQLNYIYKTTVNPKINILII